MPGVHIYVEGTPQQLAHVLTSLRGTFAIIEGADQEPKRHKPRARVAKNRAKTVPTMPLLNTEKAGS